jgi:uroporphyrinogen-III synthase
VEALGYRAVVVPLLRIEPRVALVPSGVQAIVVSSGNALPALVPGAMPLLAVGDATARRARALGFSNVHSAGRDAVALAEVVSRIVNPSVGPVLLATGAGQGGRLAADLRARGFRVIRRVCYAAVPVRRLPPEAIACLAAGDVHAALFLSAETAAVFVRLLPPEFRYALASVAALAIGKPAADLLETLPWLRVCRAENPTLDDVLALI